MKIHHREAAKRDPVTRDKAHALYMLGIGPYEIAERLGIDHSRLRQWVARGKWHEEKKQKRNLTISVVEDHMAEQVADVVLQHQKRVASVYEKQIDSLAKLESKKASDHVQISQALKNYDDVGRRNLGLSSDGDSEGKPNTFNFNLGSMQLPMKTAQVIEVNQPTDEPSKDSRTA